MVSLIINMQQSFDAYEIMDVAKNNCGAMLQTGGICDTSQLSREAHHDFHDF